MNHNPPRRRIFTAKTPLHWAIVSLLGSSPWLPFLLMIYVVQVHHNFGREMGIGAYLFAVAMMLMILLHFLSWVLAAFERITLRQFLFLNHCLIISLAVVIEEVVRRQFT